MDPLFLLAEIRSALAQAPSFTDYSPTSAIHQRWLGRVHALVSRWSPGEAVGLRVAIECLPLSLLRDTNLAQVFGLLHTAAADLEYRVLPGPTGQAFGPGAMYDFFKALSGVLGSASKRLLIVDPYMDPQIFDVYLSGVAKAVNVELLIANYVQNVKAAAAKFSTQHSLNIETRRSHEIHDRLVFVDEDTCWVLGQSIKDAATSKATYLAPLSPDVSHLKLAHYRDVWGRARSI